MEKSEHGAFLFSRPGLIFLLGVTLAGAWYEQLVMTLLTAAVLVIGLSAHGWSALSLRRLVYLRRTDTSRIFPGEEVELTVILENRKLLPLSWVEAADEIPSALLPEGLAAAPEAGSGRSLLVNVAPLLWYQRYVWRYRLAGRRRGYYRLGPVRLTSGDLFGLFPRQATMGEVDHILVYPKVYDLSDPALPSRFPLGEVQAASRLFEDPTRSIGLRQYTREASFKSIHWKASARHQELQVKVCEPTTTVEVVIFLDIGGFTDDDQFELGVSLAASLAKHFIEGDQPAGCFANAALVDNRGHGVRLPTGSGLNHLMTILEALAKVTREPAQDFAEFFEENLSAVTWGATLVLITACLSEQDMARLESLGRGGFQIAVYLMADGEAPQGQLPGGLVVDSGAVRRMMGGQAV